jgi:hypothetical protein
VDLVDVLNRHHPAWAGGSDDPRGHSRPDGTGHFHKAEAEKPVCLSGVRRRFCRYGAPIEKVRERLGRLALHWAGYAPEEIVTYLLVGLAGQSKEDIRRDVGYVLESGSSVSVARLSPIPGTREHLKASIPDGTDPRLLSNTLYLPLFRPKLWEQLEPLIRDTRSQCARPA